LLLEIQKPKAIFLSRNFGPEASAQCGYDHVTGDAAIGIACDLQDPPELVHKFLKEWEKGYPIVIGIYTKTEDIYLISLLRKIVLQNI